MAAIYWTELKWVAMLIVHNLKASAQFLLLEAIYRFCRWLSDWDDSFCIKIDNNNNDNCFDSWNKLFYTSYFSTNVFVLRVWVFLLLKQNDGREFAI